MSKMRDVLWLVTTKVSLSFFTGVFINKQLACNEMSLCYYLSTTCTEVSTDSPLLHLTMAGLPVTKADWQRLRYLIEQ